MNATEAILFERLRLRYPAPEYALLYQVPNGTGMNKTRCVDALAMGLWPGRGLHLYGFEMKTNRSDWLRELKQPAKSEAFLACHYWYIVAPVGVVLDGELPPLWGLLELHGKSLRCTKKAPQREAAPLTYSFLAAILRRVHASEEALGEAAIAEKVSAAVEKRIAEKRASEPYELRNLRREVEELKHRIADFEEASGVEIRYWGGGSIGAAVRAIEHKTPADLVADFEKIHRMAALLADQSRAGAEAIRLLPGRIRSPWVPASAGSNRAVK